MTDLNKRKIRLCTICATTFISEIFEEIITAINLQSTIKHKNISFSCWYGGKSAFTLNCEEESLFRCGENRALLWDLDNPADEISLSRSGIVDQIRQLIMQWKPDVLLLADDNGPLEKIVIKQFRSLGVPIVLYEHGFGMTMHKYSPTECLKWQTNFFSSWFFSYVLSLISKNRKTDNFTQPNLILYPSNRRKLVGQRPYFVDQIVTGAPYFDRLKRVSVKKDNKPSIIKKILVTSTGLMKFVRNWSNSRFIEILQLLTSEGRGNFEVCLRLKSGEIDKYIEAGYDIILKDCGINFVSDSAPFYTVAKECDVILTSDTSLVALDSYIMGKPVLLLDGLATPTKLSAIYKNDLQIKSLNFSQDIMTQLFKALKSPLPQLNNQLEIQKYFGPFDGGNSKRCAKAILDVVK